MSLVAGAMLAALVLGYGGVWIGGSRRMARLADPAGLLWLLLTRRLRAHRHALYAAGFWRVLPAVSGGGRRRIGAPLAARRPGVGLAVLTKGPLAVLLCALGIIVYLLLTRRNPLRACGAPLAVVDPDRRRRGGVGLVCAGFRENARRHSGRSTDAGKSGTFCARPDWAARARRAVLSITCWCDSSAPRCR